jgi:hypothetical protein
VKIQGEPEIPKVISTVIVCGTGGARAFCGVTGMHSRIPDMVIFVIMVAPTSDMFL